MDFETDHFSLWHLSMYRVPGWDCDENFEGNFVIPFRRRHLFVMVRCFDFWRIAVGKLIIDADTGLTGIMSADAERKLKNLFFSREATKAWNYGKIITAPFHDVFGKPASGREENFLIRKGRIMKAFGFTPETPPTCETAFVRERFPMSWMSH